MVKIAIITLYDQEKSTEGYYFVYEHFLRTVVNLTLMILNTIIEFMVSVLP